MKMKWIPIVREEDANGNTMIISELPESDEEVIVSADNRVHVDVFSELFGMGGFEVENIKEVDAWMPLPKPYKDGEPEAIGADCASCPVPDVGCFEQCKKEKE